MTVAELVWALNRAPLNARVRICKRVPGLEFDMAYVDNQVVQVVELDNDPSYVYIMMEAD